MGLSRYPDIFFSSPFQDAEDNLMISLAVSGKWTNAIGQLSFDALDI